MPAEGVRAFNMEPPDKMPVLDGSDGMLSAPTARVRAAVSRAHRWAASSAAVDLGRGEPADLEVELLPIEPRASDAPVAWRELEETIARPVGQHAEHVAQVDLGIELV